MYREPKGFQQRQMTRPLIEIVLSTILLLCANIGNAQETGKNRVSESCFTIHVRINGKSVEGPQTVTLKVRQAETPVSMDKGCFRIPPALISEKTLDVVFTISRNRIELSGIPTGFFTGPWDLDLADRKFDGDVSLPKHARAKEACAVVFHVGEPETAISQTKCRTLIPGTGSKGGKDTNP
jgi:hypothetical protein